MNSQAWPAYSKANLWEECSPTLICLTLELTLAAQGGDGSSTFNISTAVTFVAAAAGIAVAKHGNRSASSKVGSADVLEALGVNLAASPEQSKAALKEVGVTFLFARGWHPAMKAVAPPYAVNSKFAQCLIC